MQGAGPLLDSSECRPACDRDLPLPQASPCAPPVMEVDPQPLRTPVTAVVYIDREKVKFPTTAVGSEEVKKVRVVNKDYTPHTVSLWLLNRM